MDHETMLIIFYLAALVAAIVAVTVIVTSTISWLPFAGHTVAVALGGLAAPALLFSLGIWILHTGTPELDHDESRVYFGVFAAVALIGALITLLISTFAAQYLRRERTS